MNNFETFTYLEFAVAFSLRKREWEFFMSFNSYGRVAVMQIQKQESRSGSGRAETGFVMRTVVGTLKV